MLTFPTKYLEANPAYNAAEIFEIVVDVVSQRIVVRVAYGTYANGAFTRATNIPPKSYVFAGDDWAAFIGSAPIRDLRTALWQRLVARGDEIGSEV